ncbi:MAG: hypothetical protein PHD10_03910 [Bacilli bacterium]|nr:hypothetical protein [Bacilli bacterium]MDD4608255.1 hypothetical protein [Bacilli bacterium]
MSVNIINTYLDYKIKSIYSNIVLIGDNINEIISKKKLLIEKCIRAYYNDFVLDNKDIVCDKGLERYLKFIPNIDEKQMHYEMFETMIFFDKIKEKANYLLEIKEMSRIFLICIYIEEMTNPVTTSENITFTKLLKKLENSKKYLFTERISSSIADNKREIEQNIKKLNSKTKKFIKAYDSQILRISNKLLLKDDKFTYYDTNIKIDYKSFSNISKKVVDSILERDDVNNDFIIINTELAVYDLIKKSFSGKNNLIYIIPVDERLFRRKSNINSIISMLPNIPIKNRVYFKISYEDFIKRYNKIECFTDKINIVISNFNKIDSESDKLIGNVKLIILDDSDFAKFDEIKKFAQESKIPLIAKEKNNYEWCVNK